jgi:hypothetical protein
MASVFFCSAYGDWILAKKTHKIEKRSFVALFSEFFFTRW